ncbi:lipase family protein [Streptomyces sp. ACA25]|uniref:lipase family protein n=1 Tax=Streptomyces sp. ACA25 TaxID=3022596 RepID=UPI0023070C25|nr:lipase family protein [Streptomyces sp. ACA25]MDB1086419.1 lipase family protein [Streptomyces sp. ACA25]
MLSDRTSPRLRAGVLVTGLAVLATAFGGPAVAAGDGGTAAKTPPRAEAAGDVVSVQRSVFRTSPSERADVTSWKITYRSTSATGKRNLVSGTVLVPNDGAGSPDAPRPLVSYAVGTVGMGDRCAPSATLPRGTTAEGVLISLLLARGWAVAVTDYEGLGTRGTHTYTVGRSAGHAVLDIARAAQRLPQAAAHGITADSPVGTMGYSQGGQATGWAAQLHHTYAPGLDLRGSVAGGVPARLTAGLREDEGVGATFPLMTLIGHDAAYPDVRLAPHLNRTGRALAQRLSRGCLESNLAAGSAYRLSDLMVSDPGTSPRWQQRLEESSLGGVAPRHPVFLYHGAADDLVSPQLGEDLGRDWCARQADVEWLPLPGADHLLAIGAGQRPAADWLADRFADAPSPVTPSPATPPAGLPSAGACG